MFRRTLVPALAAALFVTAACSDPPTQSAATVGDDDFALLMFGEPGTALEGTLGPQHPHRPFDGRSGRPPLPPDLQLTEEQKAEIAALKAAFHEAHAEQLAALKAVFEAARAAREAGAAREEVRAILLEGREIARGLRVHVMELHQAIMDVLTDEQRAWLLRHRPRRFPPPIATP